MNNIPGPTVVAIDIGSTVIKIAEIERDNEIFQTFYQRTTDDQIARQVLEGLDNCRANLDHCEILCCSSANGGLRIGIICLSQSYSGTVLRNQVLLAGGNPVFQHSFTDNHFYDGYVDALVVGGGIDCPDAEPLGNRLDKLDLSGYKFGTLIYTGNCHLADRFKSRFPNAHLIPNPLGETLVGREQSLFNTLRRAYLDDLVKKDCISEVQDFLGRTICPTPHVTSNGFALAISNRSGLPANGASILLDIGGATTDLHYTSELVRPESANRPPVGSSVARHVFTDLGIRASSESVKSLLLVHPRLYQLLEVLGQKNIRQTYQAMREREFNMDDKLLSYACFFIAIERFHDGNTKFLPAVDLRKVSTILFTGGAVQGLDPVILADIFNIVLNSNTTRPSVVIDRDYRIWVDGILSMKQGDTSTLNPETFCGDN